MWSGIQDIALRLGGVADQVESTEARTSASGERKSNETKGHDDESELTRTAHNSPVFTASIPNLVIRADDDQLGKETPAKATSSSSSSSAASSSSSCIIEEILSGMKKKNGLDVTLYRGGSVDKGRKTAARVLGETEQALNRWVSLVAGNVNFYGEPFRVPSANVSGGAELRLTPRNFEARYAEFLDNRFAAAMENSLKWLRCLKDQTHSKTPSLFDLVVRTAQGKDPKDTDDGKLYKAQVSLELDAILGSSRYRGGASRAHRRRRRPAPRCSPYIRT